jgi:hypothetical protein
VAEVIFTMPGKVGDNLCRLPIAYQYAKQHDCRVDICLDWGSAGVARLLAEEPWVDQAFCTDGVIHYQQGGQPIDFGKGPAFWRQWTQVYHLGYRGYPVGNLTAAAVNDTPIDLVGLITEPCLRFVRRSARNILLHAESSRRAEDEFTAAMLADVLDAGGIPFETLVIAHHETAPEHPMYARLRRHPHRFVACPELADIATLAEEAVTFTTFSAASCLAYAAKLPVVVACAGETWLVHYDAGRSHYGLDAYVKDDREHASAALRERLHQGP